MWRIVVCVALLTSGCAFDPPPAPTVPTRIIQRPSLSSGRRACNITTVPTSKDEFCANKRTCGQIDTCGEAYYRYTTCGDLSLDAE